MRRTRARTRTTTPRCRATAGGRWRPRSRGPTTCTVSGRRPVAWRRVPRARACSFWDARPLPRRRAVACVCSDGAGVPERATGSAGEPAAATVSKKWRTQEPTFFGAAARYHTRASCPPPPLRACAPCPKTVSTHMGCLHLSALHLSAMLTGTAKEQGVLQAGRQDRESLSALRNSATRCATQCPRVICSRCSVND